MRTIISTIIIWAIVFSFFTLGVRVMATQPHAVTIAPVANDNTTYMQRQSPQHNGNSDIEIQSADDVRGRIRSSR